MPPPVVQNPLSVDLKGPPVIPLQEILSVRFGENLTRCLLLEVTVGNWDPATPGYRYDEKSRLQPGAGVRLCCGDVVLAEGNVATLAPSFPDGSAPTLRFTVEVKRTVRRTRRRVIRPALALSYGCELREFHPVLRRAARSSRFQIEATGTAGGLPTLRAGAAVKIDGVGNRFSGVYSVTETTHTFDSQSGYRTRFEAERKT